MNGRIRRKTHKTRKDVNKEQEVRKKSDRIFCIRLSALEKRLEVVLITFEQMQQPPNFEQKAQNLVKGEKEGAKLQLCSFPIGVSEKIAKLAPPFPLPS